MPDYKVSFNPKGLFLSLKVNAQLLHIQTFICTQIYIYMYECIYAIWCICVWVFYVNVLCVCIHFQT